MRYLGKLAGKGFLKLDGAADEPVRYNFDLFYRSPVGRTVSGEISAPADTLQRAFERRSLRVETADGAFVDLRFAEQTLEAGSVVAHVVSNTVGGGSSATRRI